MTRTTLPIVVSIIVSLVVTSCSLDSFLFNPQELDRYDLRTTVIPDTSRTEVTLRSGSETIYGFYVRQPDSLRVTPHPTVIYHHGNRDNLAYYWDRVELLYKAGFDVFVYDYRGFGRSTGTSDEASLIEDATAAFTYVRSRTDVDSTRIVHYGYSLGGFPALYSATNLPNCHVVITESAFASGEELVRSGTVLAIPGSYLLEGRFNNMELARVRTRPLLMLHGTDDVFISVDANGQRLFDAAAAPKTFIRVSGADHSNLPTVMGERDYIDLITAFIRGN
jgi:fermentation-respiration switch protein FrsA (DUF1100 family)